MRPRVVAVAVSAIIGLWSTSKFQGKSEPQVAPHKQQIMDVNNAIHQEYSILKAQGSMLDKEDAKKSICSRMLEDRQEDCNILIEMYHDKYETERNPPEIAYDDVVAKKGGLKQE